MRVLVTGASGYVGRAVVGELRARGHDVVALVRASSVARFEARPFAGRGGRSPAGPEARASAAAETPEARASAGLEGPSPVGFDDGASAGIEVRRGDLLDLVDALDGIDGVVHLAARTAVRESVADPVAVWRTNVSGTLNLLAAMRPGTALVFASTGSVYGTPARQPIAETVSLNPLNPYGSSKAAAEQAIGWQCATGELGAVTLRIFSAAGAADGRADRDLSRIIPKVAAVAAGLEPVVTVNGDGSAVRDFVHVADIAAAVALALDAATPGRHSVFNLGAVPASVADIIAATERVSGRQVTVEHRPASPDEARELRADTTKIRSELGWTPKWTTIEELVGDQWAAF